MEIKEAIEKFYGRLKSRKLTERQENLFEKLRDIFINSIKDVDSKGKDVFLEIGFGNGEHTYKMAMQNPNKIFIGCEPFVNGVGSLLAKIEDNNIKNILIFQGDAKAFIKDIEDNCLSGVFLLFPDPWPKRKHISRRFLQDKTIAEIHRILKKGAFWKIASDHVEYRKWILKNFEKKETLNLFETEFFSKETRPPEGCWPKTKYEKKATDDILYLIANKK